MQITDTYEALNPEVAELNLGDQIDIGVNDWCCKVTDGSLHYGHTVIEARQNAKSWINIIDNIDEV